MIRNVISSSSPSNKSIYPSYLVVTSILVVWSIVVIAVPAIFYFSYGNWNERVSNRNNCEDCECMYNNGCWDGRFKGSFSPRGYKTIWFNMEVAMIFITLDVLVYAVAAVEACKFLLNLMFEERLLLRYVFCFALLAYPNYYGFWAVFNYLNDRNWIQIDNQLFYSVTDMYASLLCLRLSDASLSGPSTTLLSSLVSAVALSHLSLAVIDQIKGGYVLIAPYQHQRIRDVALLVPEIVLMAMMWKTSNKRETLKYAAFITVGAFLWFMASPILTMLG